MAVWAAAAVPMAREEGVALFLLDNGTKSNLLPESDTLGSQLLDSRRSTANLSRSSTVLRERSLLPALICLTAAALRRTSSSKGGSVVRPENRNRLLWVEGVSSTSSAAVIG
jgi:hypothetical protein